MQQVSQSVFNMTSEERDWYTTNRLYPQESAHGIWGCASRSGFLKVGENLLECCEKDRQLLNDRQVTYDSLTQKILSIWNAAAATRQQSSVVKDKFKVVFDYPSICYQYCPFSPKDVIFRPDFIVDQVQGFCGKGNINVTIENIEKKRSIKFSSLLVHLIQSHHFFEGQVPYRLSPADVIDVLEIQPDPNFSANT